MGLLLGQAVLHVVVHIVGRWTLPFAAVYTALNIAFAATFAGLALNGMLVNRAFAAKIGWPSLPDARRASVTNRRQPSVSS